MNPKTALENIFNFYGENTLYISSTGYLSRLAYQANKENNFKYTIFYMQGSMGLAPCIGLGITLCNRNFTVVVLNGDGSYLMQLGFDFLLENYIRKEKIRINQIIFVNNCYESTGGQCFSNTILSLIKEGRENSFVKVDKIKEVPGRVEITPEENTRQVMDFLRGNTNAKSL